MQTIIVKLDIHKLDNMDLGLLDEIIKKVDKASDGAISDGDYGYFSPTSDAAVWLRAEDSKSAAEILIRLFRSEKILENDLSKAAEIYISEEDHALLFDCIKVYPTE